MKLQDYLRVLRKRWRWLAASMLLGVLAAVAVTMSITPLYRASSKIFVAPGAVSTTSELAQGSTFAQNRVKSYVQVISSDLVLAPVAEEFGISVESLAPKVVATVPTDTVLIDIAVTDSSPTQAAAIATTIAEKFPDIARSIEPPRADETPAVTVTVTQVAAVPSSPISPRLELNVGLGLLAGALAGLVLMAVREATDTRLKSERDVTSVSSTPVLGRIPLDPRAKSRPLVVEADPNGLQSESFRQLRTNLEFAASGRDRTVLVTSSIPGEGKSSTAINLALSLAAAGSRVCLVDADLRRSGLSRYLDLEPSVGLTSVLIGQVGLDTALQPWGDGKLQVLMSGQQPPNPSEMLSGPGMDQVLEQLRSRFDIVIVDSAPLLPVTDSVVLARRCGGVVLVVGTGQVHRRELHRSLSDLDAVDAPLIGIVLTKVPTRGPDGAGLKSYGYRSVKATSAKAPRDRQDDGDGRANPSKGAPRNENTARPAQAAELVSPMMAFDPSALLASPRRVEA